MSEIPEWFWEAVETKPESAYVDVDDCDIHYQVWGDSDKRGLLFVHGHNAHAHWWDFIAPDFMNDFSVAALDLSGMGDSDHRDEYSQDKFAEEILNVASAAKLSRDMVVVAHSFGGIMATRAASLEKDRLKGLVLVDSGVKHPDDVKEHHVEQWNRPKVYPNFDVACARFRLQPPQTCENEYIVKYIARNSVEHIDDGWVWKFDEELNSRMVGSGDVEQDFKSLTCRTALIYGQNSESMGKASADLMQEMRPDLTVIELAGAQHHVFLDQPLAFKEALKSILSAW